MVCKLHLHKAGFVWGFFQISIHISADVSVQCQPLGGDLCSPQPPWVTKGPDRVRHGRAGARGGVWRCLVDQGSPEGTGSGDTGRDGEEEASTGR